MVNQHSIIFQKFENTVRSLRVNETKPTLSNAYISDHFALGGEKESKFDKITLLGGSLQKHDLSVNP